jgi:hypothetical protein
VQVATEYLHGQLRAAAALPHKRPTVGHSLADSVTSETEEDLVLQQGIRTHSPDFTAHKPVTTATEVSEFLNTRGEYSARVNYSTIFPFGGSSEQSTV